MEYAHVIRGIFITCFSIVLIYTMGQEPTAQSINQQAVNFGRSGEFDKAEELLLSAITITPDYGPTYNNLGVLYRNQGKYDIALDYFSEAEKIFLNEQDLKNLAGIYSNKGLTYKDLGDYFQALKYLNNSLNLYLDSDENDITKINIGKVYNNLGIVFLRQGSYANALDAFEQSMEYKKIYQPKDLSTAYSNCAQVYQERGDYEEADRYYQLSIDNKITYYGESYFKLAESYINFGQLKIIQKNEEEGKIFFRKAEEIYLQNFGEKNPFLANVYLPEGNLYLSNNNFRSALERYQLSLICALEDFSDTNIFVNPEPHNLNPEIRTLNILRNKANALYAYHHSISDASIEILDECLKTYDLTLDLIAMMRGSFLNDESKLFLTDNTRSIFNSALDIAYDGYRKTGDKKYMHKAFEYAEKGKAALVSAAISDLENKKIYGIPLEIQLKEKDILAETEFYKKNIYNVRLRTNPDSAKINLWQRKILDLSKEYDSLLNYLQINYPDYYALKYDHRVVTLEEVQESLGPDESVVEYALTDSSLFITVISSDDADIVRKDIDTVFYQRMDYLINFLKDNRFANTNYDQYREYVESSYALFELLFGGIYDGIMNDNLLIIPDDKLGYIPFESLLTDMPEYSGMDFRNLRYMIYNNQFNYSYSASLFFLQEIDEERGETRLLAFAPTYDNLDDIDTSKFLASRDYIDYLVPLKYLKEEISGISDILDAEVYLDYEATEQVFWNKAGDYDILHFAMHTLINDANPMFSQLVFTLTNDTVENNDGLLNTYEIYNMNLNARMAVLSACNTGYGKLQKGEGIMSLARGFIYAGVPSIIMTLWAVEDKSGSELMTRFYKFLSEGDAIDEALRKAKLEYLSTADQLRSHPYLWASYVSIGKVEPIYPAGLNMIYVLAGAALIIAGLVIFLSCKNRRRKLFEKRDDNRQPTTDNLSGH